jgi:hypothetical protein
MQKYTKKSKINNKLIYNIYLRNTNNNNNNKSVNKSQLELYQNELRLNKEISEKYKEDLKNQITERKQMRINEKLNDRKYMNEVMNKDSISRDRETIETELRKQKIKNEMIKGNDYLRDVNKRIQEVTINKII